MKEPTISFTIDITLNDARDPETKVADAELHFVRGPLAGLKLSGFAVWQPRIGTTRYVTVPARQSYVNGEPYTRALLRPINQDNRTAYEPIRALILAACRAAEAEASATIAEQLVRETLQPIHRLTDEQAIELTEDIIVVMRVEQLNPRGAWRLIVARIGGIHNLPGHLTVLTSRHRFKQAQARRDTQRRYAARLYVGPDSDSVREIAECMRKAGLTVTIEAAEHIHYTIQAPSPQAVAQHTIDALRDALSPTDISGGYSWSWVADRVYDVHLDDGVSSQHLPPRHASPEDRLH